MKSKMFAIGFSLLLMAAVVATAGSTAEETVSPVVSEAPDPQYGGTITWFSTDTTTPGIPDMHEQSYPGLIWTGPVLDRFCMGDVEKYGPRGTNEFNFGVTKQIPLARMKGNLAESWDVAADKIVFHIRHGVYWTGKSINPGVMERRLYTANDFVFNLNRLLEMPGGAALKAADFIQTPYKENVYAKDEYTVIVETKRFHPEWSYYIEGFEGQHMAPEMVKAGPKEWKNLVGTGAFILTEYVPNSHLSYAPNPDYWRTTVINGKEYKIPFVDKLVLPLIKDMSTHIAALRTATVDIHTKVTVDNAETLAKTSPELLKATAPGSDVYAIWLRTDQPPLNNREVRRALMIGTDRQAIFDAVYRLGQTYAWPIAPGVPGHVPLDKLPAETRLLFDYNPELARQMLAKAGYPDGFELEMNGYLKPEIDGTLEMVAGMWAEDLNVKVQIKQYDSVAMTKIRNERTYNQSMVFDGHPYLAFEVLGTSFYTGAPENYAQYSNRRFDEQFDKAIGTIDPDKRAAILEELFVTVLNEALTIPISTVDRYSFWWPWLKNYYGEKSYNIVNPPLDLAWIDQALKKNMGH